MPSFTRTTLKPDGGGISSLKCTGTGQVQWPSNGQARANLENRPFRRRDNRPQNLEWSTFSSPRVNGLVA